MRGVLVKLVAKILSKNKIQHKTLIILNLNFRKICFFVVFDNFGFFENVVLYFWCVLYYKLLFLMRLSDSVSFSVSVNLF